ncbi:MAG: cytochrome ubiquinol oxidase subunit I [Paludibacteraceae bacterium]|nr:cytochrome ubiquinol oxidase subunit I [Paludibacteraceae bacterium]
MDVEILSRIQFALTVSFHYLFPPLSIGLGLLLVAMEGLYLKTKNPVYETLAKFWTKLFAITFTVGVATGVVMEFEFGTNWATYSRFVGDIFGSPLAIEGLFAFALESTFLGILVFGWNKTKPTTHFIATIGVWLGSMLSAIWIIVANSWQQTPAGFQLVVNGSKMRAEITDFWAMVFNPSSMDRVFHVWMGAFLSGAFLVLSVHAYYILKNRHVELSKKAFKIALAVIIVVSFVQLFSGHRSANIVAKYQPVKLASLEGHWDSIAPADMYLFGYIDKKAEKTYGIAIPGGLSFLTSTSFKTPVQGLKAVPRQDRPGPLNLVFQFYHVMIILGVFFIGYSLLMLFLWWRGKLFSYKWVLWLTTFSVVLPQIANQVGWYATEIGRQPWIVYKLLRTSDALSKAVQAQQVVFSIILFSVVYLILFALFIYLLRKSILTGPEKD